MAPSKRSRSGEPDVGTWLASPELRRCMDRGALLLAVAPRAVLSLPLAGIVAPFIDTTDLDIGTDPVPFVASLDASAADGIGGMEQALTHLAGAPLTCSTGYQGIGVDAAKLLSMFPTLISLSVGGFADDTVVPVFVDAVLSLPLLRELDLMRVTCTASDTAMASLGSHPSLETLVIPNFKCSATAVTAFADAQAERLSLKSFTVPEIKRPSVFEAIARITSLTSLSVMSNEYADPLPFMFDGRAAKALSKLKLRALSCFSLCRASWVAIGQWADLEELTVDGLFAEDDSDDEWEDEDGSGGDVPSNDGSNNGDDGERSSEESDGIAGDDCSDVIVDCSNTAKGFDVFAATTKISKLSVHATGDSSIVKTIARIKTLRSLELAECYFPDPDALQALADLPLLSTVQVYAGSHGQGTVPIHHLAAVKSLTSIKVFALNSGWDGRMSALARHPKLEELVIKADGPRITADDIKALGTIATLRTLDLSYAGARCTPELAASYLPQVRNVNVRFGSY